VLADDEFGDTDSLKHLFVVERNVPGTNQG